MQRVLVQALVPVAAPLLVFCVTSGKLLSSLSPVFLSALFLACLLWGYFDVQIC